MIKVINISQHSDNYVKALVQHPIKEFGQFTLHALKDHQTKGYVFTIPSHDWVYYKKRDVKINVKFAPSSFNHPRYKAQLMEVMEYLIQIIEDFND